MACAKVISDFEVLSARDAGRRRDWTDEEKIRIVEESLLGHRQGSATARRVGISRALLTRWRAEYRAGRLSRIGPTFTAVTFAPEAAPVEVCEAPSPPVAGNVRKGKPAHEISPIALEAVNRIDALFDIERGINGKSTEERLAVRQELSRPLVDDLYDWLQARRVQMSKHNPVAKAIDYMFEKEGRREAFTRFLHDGRLCLTNNSAERALRGAALGRKSWLFAGSQRGGERAAFMYSLIVTAKMNDIDPQAWLADVLARMPNMPVSRLPELLPWNWSQTAALRQEAA